MAMWLMHGTSQLGWVARNEQWRVTGISVCERCVIRNATNEELQMRFKLVQTVVMCVWQLVVIFSRVNGVFGRFDLAALCGCHTLNVCLFV